MRKEQSLKSRLLLSLFPIAIVFVLLGIEILVRQHMLFTSLVSSIFLIYLLPDDPMNDSLTIVISQALAALIGYAGYWLLGNSYLSACLSILMITLLLVLIGRLHPPAIATSMIFQYRTHSESDLVLFGLLLVLIVVLFLAKKLFSYLQRKLGG